MRKSKPLAQSTGREVTRNKLQNMNTNSNGDNECNGPRSAQGPQREAPIGASTPASENKNLRGVPAAEKSTAAKAEGVAHATHGAIHKVSVLCSNPDALGISYLGRYTDESHDWAIIRYGPNRGRFIADLEQKSELPQRQEFLRFFIPDAFGETPGSDDFREYGLRDFAYLEALRTGDWWNIYIFAEAEVSLQAHLRFKSSRAGRWVTSDQLMAEIPWKTLVWRSYTICGSCWNNLDSAAR